MSLPINPTTQQDYRDDMGLISAPWGVQEELLVPVKVVGDGIPRARAAQKMQTYLFTISTATTDYTQIATVTSSKRVFFLGVIGRSTSTASMYVEDADSGNIAPSSGSTVGLAYTNTLGVQIVQFPPFPYECKRGIRLRTVNSAATEQTFIVYYLEEDIQR